MKALDEFLNSLSEKDKGVLDDINKSSKLNSEKTQEELAIETYTRILDLQIASGKIPESKRDEIILAISHGKDCA
jgi:hypothetical protein